MSGRAELLVAAAALLVSSSIGCGIEVPEGADEVTVDVTGALVAGISQPIHNCTATSGTMTKHINGHFYWVTPTNPGTNITISCPLVSRPPTTTRVTLQGIYYWDYNPSQAIGCQIRAMPGSAWTSTMVSTNNTTPQTITYGDGTVVNLFQTTGSFALNVSAPQTLAAICTVRSDTFLSEIKYSYTY